MFEVLTKLITPIVDQCPKYFSTKGCVFAMFLIVYIAKFVHVLLSITLLKKYDNVQGNHAGPGSGGVDENSGRNYRATVRALNAHKNSWEAFIGFAVAILLALQAGKDNSEVNKLANAFLMVRLVYIVVYVIAYNEALSVLRSATFAVGLGIILRIFTIAAGDLKF